MIELLPNFLSSFIIKCSLNISDFFHLGLKKKETRFIHFDADESDKQVFVAIAPGNTVYSIILYSLKTIDKRMYTQPRSRFWQKPNHMQGIQDNQEKNNNTVKLYVGYQSGALLPKLKIFSWCMIGQYLPSLNALTNDVYALLKMNGVHLVDIMRLHMLSKPKYIKCSWLFCTGLRNNTSFLW